MGLYAGYSAESGTWRVYRPGDNGDPSFTAIQGAIISEWPLTDIASPSLDQPSADAVYLDGSVG